MKFSPFIVNNQVIGHVAELPWGRMVFGNRHLTQTGLNEHFPKIDFCFLKQIHSKNYVGAQSDFIAQADAHGTTKLGVAPVIQTADCLPILLLNKSHAVAIHAGWRGLALGIITETLAQLNQDPAEWMVGIGPHIFAQHFEFGRELLPELLQNFTGSCESFIFATDNPQKVRIDLLQFAVLQLQKASLSADQIHAVVIDTYVSPDHISFRRNGGERLRQFSFVVRN